VLAERLRPLRCRYVQIGVDADKLGIRVASEDLVPEEPFGLALRIDPALGCPSLHVLRFLPVPTARHASESITMIGYLTPDEVAATLARVREGATVKAEMLRATRIAVDRGYVIPGAAGEVERWFRSNREGLDASDEQPSAALDHLVAALDRAATPPTLDPDTLSVLRGTGMLSLVRDFVPGDPDADPT
jgi:hypothetical protein